MGHRRWKGEGEHGQQDYLCAFPTVAWKPVVKSLPSSSGDMKDVGLIPGSEMATFSSISAWKIPWTEETDGLQSIRLKRVRPHTHNSGLEAVE